MKKFLPLWVGCILFFLIVAPSALARSFTIDQVDIRGWIQPNGDLLVNEIFTYTFDGKYKQVSRSIQRKGNEGVTNYYSYELVNPEAKLGNVKMSDLKQLPVEVKGYTFISKTPSQDEKRSFFYTYTLKNAIKSYDTYSDLTIPFFGTDENHDIALSNVKIDIFFPEEVDPSRIHAFFHDRQGKVLSKDSWGVHFSTPLSDMYQLTETRMLFPSTIMKEQKKVAAPVPLHKVVSQENEHEKVLQTKMELKKQFSSVLIGLCIVTSFACFILIVRNLLPTRKDGNSILNKDPLTLHMIHNRGRLTPYSFLAGLYSLVEKGAATVVIRKTGDRFQKSEKAPKHTLCFKLTKRERQLEPTEKKLVSWLFVRNAVKGERIYVLTDSAGAMEKNSGNYKYYHNKYRKFKNLEEEWFDSVLLDMKQERVLKDKPYLIFIRFLLPLLFGMVLFSYIVDSLSVTAISVYSIIGGIFLVVGWMKIKRKRWNFFFLAISILATVMLVDGDLMMLQLSFLLLTILFYCLIPGMAFSKEARAVYCEIKAFKKQIKRKGIPADIHDETELEKWITRVFLLVKHRRYKKYFSQYLVVSPLATVLIEEGDPVNYLVSTWQLTSANISSSSSGYDSSGSYGDSGGFGGGGGDGGGAGAD